MNDLAEIATKPLIIGLTSLAGIASGISLVVGLIKYYREAGDRRKAKHYQAWQVINSATHKGGSGGRLDALQDLVQDHVSLVGIDLDNAWLCGAKLPYANIRHASLCDTILSEADLRRARLNCCKAQRVSFHNARLDGATLADSDLSGGNFVGSDLVGAWFDGTTMVWADLLYANLRETSFYQADLRYVRLEDIRGWQAIKNISCANIWGVIGAPAGFRSWALSNGAVEVETDEEWKTILTDNRKARTSSADIP